MRSLNGVCGPRTAEDHTLVKHRLDSAMVQLDWQLERASGNGAGRVAAVIRIKATKVVYAQMLYVRHGSQVVHYAFAPSDSDRQ